MRGFLMLMLVACGGAEEALPTAGCPSTERPAIESCVQGRTFTECGGSGPPQLACNAAFNDCRWFTTSCVAAGFTASTCSADDICCVDDWPFAKPGPGGKLQLEPFNLLQGAGLQPWDRAREMNVTVVVDGTLQHGDGQFHCDGPWPGSGTGNPCSMPAVAEPYVVRSAEVTALGLSRFTGPTFSGSSLVAEVDPATLKARVCTWTYTDGVSYQCSRASEPVCASGGTLRFSALPDAAGVAGTIDVQLGAAHITASF